MPASRASPRVRPLRVILQTTDTTQHVERTTTTTTSKHHHHHHRRRPHQHSYCQQNTHQQSLIVLD